MDLVRFWPSAEIRAGSIDPPSCLVAVADINVGIEFGHFLAVGTTLLVQALGHGP